MSQAQYRIVMMKVEPLPAAAIVSLCHEHYERVIDETMTSERCDFVQWFLFVIDRKAKVKCDACHDNHPFMLDDVSRQRLGVERCSSRPSQDD